MGILVSRNHSGNTLIEVSIVKKYLKMGIQYYAFAVVALAASASALKCYVATSADNSTGSLTTTTECVSPLDVCTRITTDGKGVLACSQASLLTAAGAKADACTTTASIETCLCAKDGCNSAPTQSATQATILFAVASILKHASVQRTVAILPQLNLQLKLPYYLLLPL